MFFIKSYGTFCRTLSNVGDLYTTSFRFSFSSFNFKSSILLFLAYTTEDQILVSIMNNCISLSYEDFYSILFDRVFCVKFSSSIRVNRSDVPCGITFYKYCSTRTFWDFETKAHLPFYGLLGSFCSIFTPRSLIYQWLAIKGQKESKSRPSK